MRVLFNFCFHFKYASALGERVNSSAVTPPPAICLMVQCGAPNIRRINAFPNPQIKVRVSIERVAINAKDASLVSHIKGRIQTEGV
jgi:hypothetical protein